MNTSKKVDVNYSSLVGLKAELLRKQTEVKEAKTKNEIKNSSFSKSKTKVRKIKNSLANKEENDESSAAEIDDCDYLKSRYMLEAKSRLYDKLQRRECHDDEIQHYLVDFSKASSSYSSTHLLPSKVNINKMENSDNISSNYEEAWVEYQDCFGRTRKCLRKDLSKLKEEDGMIKQEIKNDSSDSELEYSHKRCRLLSPTREPEMEKLRSKWEKQDENLSHKQDIHYQDILFDEARMHGVGYYAFSNNEEERIMQQKKLFDLRKETEQRQREKQNSKELKARIERNRLKAARIRQRIRAGLPAECEKEETTSISEETREKSELLTKIDQPPPNDNENKERNNVAIIEDKIKAFGELLGKRPEFKELSQEEWLEKKRKDRICEFAPIYDHFKSSEKVEKTTNNSISKIHNNEEDSSRIGLNEFEPSHLEENRNPITTNPKESGHFHDSSVAIKQSHVSISIDPWKFLPSVENTDLESFDISNIPSIDILRFVPPEKPNSNFYDNDDLPHCIEETERNDNSKLIKSLDDNKMTIHDDVANKPTIPALNLDNISEGLKYLRKQYDQNKDKEN